ncbi:MAG TPA: hypothetical protein VK614_06435 [Allosphingosinicella sp.]|nr:hypothetical protein [Allosphingosinicella sp.]
MTDSARRAAPRRTIPAFTPVPVRARKDGWMPERQREFIRLLHVRPDIGKAARAVGMSRRSAYRLRERFGAESFAAAWDAAFALRPPPARTNLSQLWYRALFGKTRPIVRGGKQVGTITQPDNAAGLKLLDRFDRKARDAARRQAFWDRRGRSQ